MINFNDDNIDHNNNYNFEAIYETELNTQSTKINSNGFSNNIFFTFLKFIENFVDRPSNDHQTTTNRPSIDH